MASVSVARDQQKGSTGSFFVSCLIVGNVPCAMHVPRHSHARLPVLGDGGVFLSCSYVIVRLPPVQPAVSWPCWQRCVCCTGLHVQGQAGRASISTLRVRWPLLAAVPRPPVGWSTACRFMLSLLMCWGCSSQAPGRLLAVRSSALPRGLHWSQLLADQYGG